MTAICEAVDELCLEGPGDILVFLSGEREIRDAEDALRSSLGVRVSDPRSPQRGRAPPPVQPAVRRRAAPRVRAAPEPARRPVHQRRGDVADRAGHPVRDRPRHRAHLALLQGDEGAAAADRAHLAGVRQPALGPLRARRGRHRDPAVLAGRLRRAAVVHRAGDPSYIARVGDPADDRGGRRDDAGGHRRLPVRRPAGHPRGPRRRPAAHRARCAGRRPADRDRPRAGAAADGPAAGPDDRRGRSPVGGPRGHDHRRRAVHPGPARAPGRGAREGRPVALPVRRSHL